jgi:hypothetical protein
MDRFLLDTPETPEINISKIKGTLRLKGWDRTQIRADMEYRDTLETEYEGEIITCSCESGCLVRVPNDSMLNIEEVLNDLVIKSVDGPIKINKVNGQIMVKSIGSITVEKALGNFNAKHIEGDLECGKITGNANIQDVDGQVILNKVVGNLTMRGYAASLNAAVTGNANLRLEPEPGGEYSVSAKGNINCRLEPFANATISLTSKSEKIRINLPEEKGTLSVKNHVIVLGDGESEVKLEAAGNIEISGSSEYRYQDEFDFEEIGEFATLADDISQMVTGQIESQMDSITQHINDLTSNLPGVDTRSSEKTRRKLEAKRRNLERKLASAERKAEFKARQAERRLDRRRQKEQIGRKPTSEPISNEERQKVLEMLQHQQINVTEAEILLAALEGRTPEPPIKPDTQAETADDQPEEVENPEE